MRITLIVFGKIKAKHWRAATTEYQNRLSHYTNYQLIELKDTSFSEKEIEQAVAGESERLITNLPTNAFFIALDSRGSQLSSLDFANVLNEKQLYGPSEIVFAIGGAFGFSDAVLKRANYVLSLSEMTLPHELARVVLLEQLYRGFSILRGEKYHK